MARAIKDANGRWRVRYTDPAGRRRSRTFPTAKAGNDFLATVRTSLSTGRYRSPEVGDLLFADWAANYFVVSGPRLSPSTRAWHASIYRSYIGPQWDTWPMKTLNRNDIALWVAGLSNEEVTQRRRWDRTTKTYVAGGGPLAPRTVAQVFNIFRTIVRAAVAEGLILDPLPSRPPVPPIKPKKERYLRTMEIARLASCMPDRYRALIYLCCYGGTRIGETAALQLGDIDWDGNRVRVSEGQTEVSGIVDYQTPKTAAGNRWVPLADLVVTVLREHVETFVGWEDPDAYLFSSPTGEVFRVHNWRKRVFDRAVKESGLERLTPHDMRHTAASILISEGANRLELGSILGHTDGRMVDKVYGHLFEEDREALRQRVSKRAQAGEPKEPKAATPKAKKRAQPKK